MPPSPATRSTCPACSASRTTSPAWWTGGIGPETRAALAHVERILGACGASLADLVKVSAFLPDLGEWDAMNAAYVNLLGPDTPARIAVGCDALLFGARVELDCIAYRPPA